MYQIQIVYVFLFFLPDLESKNIDKPVGDNSTNLGAIKDSTELGQLKDDSSKNIGFEESQDHGTLSSSPDGLKNTIKTDDKVKTRLGNTSSRNNQKRRWNETMNFAIKNLRQSR